MSKGENPFTFIKNKSQYLLLCDKLSCVCVGWEGETKREGKTERGHGHSVQCSVIKRMRIMDKGTRGQR
jgi:hypothetical protein